MIAFRFRPPDCVDDEWLIVGLSRADPGSGLKEANSLASLVESDSEMIAVMDAEVRKLFDESAGFLLDESSPAITTAIILIPWKQPLAFYGHIDAPVFSFVCSASVLKALLASYPDCPVNKLCFTLLRAIMDGHLRVDNILVRQLPYTTPIATCDSPSVPASIIMAHRGNQQHLRMALHFAKRAGGRNLRIRVCLDDDSPAEYLLLAERYSDVDFFYLQPSPLGPYIARQELAERSSEPFLIFHDSDDISCYDRFSALYKEMRSTGCDLIGSHELRVNEMHQEVVAVRFPLDASIALSGGYGHALLHPTSMVKRDSFFAAGGFSTDNMISNDTQFLLRAYFTLRIRNVDSFLYIRRKHPSALTVSPKTALGTPARLALEKAWEADFEAVKRGKLSLDESSLRPIRGSADYEILQLKPYSKR